MDYNKISRCVKNILLNSKCEYEEIVSISTNSIYYRIGAGKDTLLFRISDHKTDKRIVTFRTDIGSPNNKKLEIFVKNRIEDLKYRRIKKMLGV